ncbi:uncharacterized protein LOC116245981 [Nymphaea colorata]|nr:uncharacterized protein LOC116245981 [Nymphaea colorata]
MPNTIALNDNDRMASTNEPVLARLDRLEHLTANLEDVKGVRSGKSSSVSTPRSGTTSSGGIYSESPSSPASLESRCRPLNEVLVETQLKGTIVDRLDDLENRVVKLEELMLTTRNEEGNGGKTAGGGMRLVEELEEAHGGQEEKPRKKKHRGTLKRLVKTCVSRKPKGP